jgi:hypothetical protein
MYDEGELLQANVTLIAGVLIFLTVTPLSRGVMEILVRRHNLIIIWITLTLFMFSIILLSFLPSPTDQERDLTFYLPRAFFIAGVIGIVSAVAGIAGTLSGILKRLKEPS